jgi:hypothetical protein
MPRRWRFVLYGFIAGSLLGFGAGCARASAENRRMVEQMRAEDPDAHVCGLIVVAEFAVGLVCAVPAGLLGAALGAATGAAAKRLLAGDGAA